MDEGIALSAVATKLGVFTADAGCLKREKELQLTNQKLMADIERLQERLAFVEELVGPTECQRKTFQTQLTFAREAALRVAHSCSGSVPTRCVGRLDESWLRLRGLSDQECSMLQRGCVSGDNGVPCDISMLGDPLFCPYDRNTLQPRWEAKGGFLQLSLGDVRDKWGEEVALEVVRCAIELDRQMAETQRLRTRSWTLNVLAVAAVGLVLRCGGSARHSSMAAVTPLRRTASQPLRRRGRRPRPQPRRGSRKKLSNFEVPMFASDSEAKARRRQLLEEAGPVVQMLIGDAIGDAFGAIIEMQVAKEPYAKEPTCRTQGK
ncbi:unnamed protein product [Effrenium voratum]|nr:unnamed protein product [Effrenium voratum]